MSDFGLSPKGFKRKRYDDIIKSMETRAKNLFGENVNLSIRSPLGLFLRVVAWSIGVLWQLAEKVYFSGYVDTAEGKSLHGVGKYIGITPGRANKSNVFILASGEQGTEINPENLIIETKDGIEFIPAETKTIGEEPTLIKFICSTPGIIGNVPADTITEITKPIAGLESVTNPEAARDGRDAEKDEEFRDRYDRSISKGGSSTSMSIEAALLELEGVRDAIVRENDSMQEVDGIPPKSVAPFVFGGNDVDIVNSILKSKAGGIRSFGDIQLTVADSRGKEHIIGFSRPTEAGIFVKITLVTDDNFPSDGGQRIKTATIKYIGGIDQVDGVVTEYNGLGLGQNVVHTKIVSLGHIVNGVTDVNVELSKDGENWVSQNIIINSNEVAITDFNMVVVEC